MEIATRHIEMTSNIYYNDGHQLIKLDEWYDGYNKIPVLKYKIVEFRNKYGDIDNERSYDCRLLDDEIDDFGSGYNNLDIKMLITIHFTDNSTQYVSFYKYHYPKITCLRCDFLHHSKWCRNCNYCSYSVHYINREGIDPDRFHYSGYIIQKYSSIAEFVDYLKGQEMRHYAKKWCKNNQKYQSSDFKL